MKDNATNILIVEDEPIIIELFREFLFDGFRLSFAMSSFEATSSLVDNIYNLDIILLDHNLPDSSGIEVLKQVKKLRPGLPVIMITAYGNEDIAADAFRYGAREYIKKPFSRNELIEKIYFCLALGQVPKYTARRVLTVEDENVPLALRNAGKSGNKIQRAIDYINGNLSSRFTLDTVANAACMSKYHFSRVFKETVGCTYQDYLNNLRINKAVSMLNDKNMTITDIAFSIGYSDLSHFARIFKRNTGYNPSTFRKKLKISVCKESPLANP